MDWIDQLFSTKSLQKNEIEAYHWKIISNIFTTKYNVKYPLVLDFIYLVYISKS